MAIEKSSYSMIRGDVTWYKQSRARGSHEFQTGFLLMPRNYYKGTNIVHRSQRADGGIGEAERPEQHQLRDDPVRTHVSATSALETVNTEGRDRDYGVYVQDTWRPIQRLTMTLGVRSRLRPALRLAAELRDREVRRARAAPRRRAPAGRRREERRAGQLRARAPAADGRPGRRGGVLRQPDVILEDDNTTPTATGFLSPRC